MEWATLIDKNPTIFLAVQISISSISKIVFPYSLISNYTDIRNFASPFLLVSSDCYRVLNNLAFKLICGNLLIHNLVPWLSHQIHDANYFPLCYWELIVSVFLLDYICCNNQSLLLSRMLLLTVFTVFFICVFQTLFWYLYLYLSIYICCKLQVLQDLVLQLSLLLELLDISSYGGR